MKRTALGVVALSGLIVLAGCQSPTAPSDPTKVEGVVTMWNFEDPEGQFLPTLKEEFEAAYPGVTLELTEVPEDNYVTKVDTALLAQQPPDVGFVYEARWMKAGSFLPLADVIAEYDVDVANFNQVAMSAAEYDGEVYGLGSIAGSVMLIYNKDLFDEAGLPYPSAEEPMTIDEFATVATQLHDALGIWGAVPGNPVTWTDKSNMFSPDGKEVVADSDSTVHLFEVVTGLSRDGVSPAPSESDLVGPADMLATGDVVMAITDMEHVGAVMEEAGYNWGAAPPPVASAGDPSYVFVGTDAYGVFTKSQNPTAAKALVAFIGTEGSRIRAEVTDNPPLDGTLLESWAGDNAGRQSAVAVLLGSTSPAFFVPGFWEVTSSLSDIYELAGNGEGDVADMIESDIANMQESLDREWETWDEIQ